MKKIFVLLLLVMVPGLRFAQPKQNPRSKPFVFTHVTVIDTTGAPAKPDMTVMITGDRIIELGKTGEIRIPKDAQVVDATGKFLIPGLWDMHGHLTGMERDVVLPLCIANGVTGVRDMGGDLHLLHQWQKQVALGSVVGPRLVVAGPILDGPTPGYPLRITVKNAPRRGRQWILSSGAAWLSSKCMPTCRAKPTSLSLMRPKNKGCHSPVIYPSR